MLLVFN